jgi:hypothetical protein
MFTEKTFTGIQPVLIDAASFRVSCPTLEECPEIKMGVPGRLYTVEAIDKDGNAKKLSRVQSFKFEVDAKGYGLVTISYIDHDPTAVDSFDYHG